MKNLLILGLTIFLFTSCLKDEDIKFEITSSASYILQEEAENDSFTFSPMIFISSTNTEHKISNFTIQNSTQAIETKKLSDYDWVTTGSFPSLSAMNGKYTVIVTNQKDETITDELEFAFEDTDIVGEIKVDSFEYVNNVLKAKVFVPDNSIAVGFSLNHAEKEAEFKAEYRALYYCVYEYSSTLTDSKTGKETQVTTTLMDQATDGAVYIKMQFDTDSDADMYYVNLAEVGIFAASKKGVHRVGPKQMLSKNAQTF